MRFYKKKVLTPFSSKKEKEKWQFTKGFFADDFSDLYYLVKEEKDLGYMKLGGSVDCPFRYRGCYQGYRFFYPIKQEESE